MSGRPLPQVCTQMIIKDVGHVAIASLCSSERKPTSWLFCCSTISERVLRANLHLEVIESVQLWQKRRRMKKKKGSHKRKKM